MRHLLIATLAGLLYAQDPGYISSTSIDGINQVAHLVSPFIFGHLRDLKLPDVTFSKGQMTSINVKIHEPEKPGDLVFSLRPRNNSVAMAVDELNSEIQGDFDVRLLGIHVTGVAYVTIKDVHFGIELGLKTQMDTDGRYAPAIQLRDMNINIDPDKIDIRLEGGLVTSLFAEIFKNEILGQIISNTKKQAHETIDIEANRDLLEYFGTQKCLSNFPNDLVYDYSIVNGDSGVTVDSSGKFITFEGNGTFYQNRNPASWPKETPPVIPLRYFKGKAF